MRRYKKKELLETAEMLVEANEVIDRLCKSNTERALEILGQCQESAILLGNLIESKGDGYAELVEILENYCENIYQMSIAVSDEEQIRKLSKKIQKQLTYLNNKIRLEIPEDKKEVVFFPYKASMWDSLESVWMAADADEGTDAYVVPIPYYDKNPDGTFREMHYEGDQYPDYVSVTNYEEYDFEERRPDIIFIHNPYDQFNYVTSVHPRFYSGNLKQYTEKLVYIPYFILGEIKPDDEEALKGMKHFCINEAVKNADKVIVQSEDMRQVYIEVLTRESGGSKEARAYWEGKIDGSGSPKVDKVLRTKKEDVEIPEEWLKVIKKSDGSWKKIVFYNTSVTALLEHDEQMLKKIESVFRIFRENKNEVALFWRPHPLMESTLISMRPKLWENYRKIREEYKEESWGIYDDSADMDRAIVLSDGYYGDWSSVVWLYQKIGKPVMIQDAGINSKSDDNHYLLNSWIRDKTDVYFVPHNLNVLVKYSEEEQKSKWIIPILNAEQEKYALYSDIKKYKNKLFFVPLHDTKIVIYDLDTKSFDWISIPSSKYWDCAWGNFSRAYSYGKKLYLVGYHYPGIILLDMETYKCEQVLDVYTLHNRKAEKQYIALESFEINGYIYMLLPDICELIKYSIKDNKSIVYHLVNDSKEKYQTIAYDGEDFWFTSNGIEFLKWNEEKQEGEIFVHPEREKIPENSIYKYSFFCEGRLYALSSKEAPITVIDCNDFKQSRLIWKDKDRRKGYCVDYLYRTGQECSFIDLENKSNKFLDIQTGQIAETKWVKDKKKIIQMLLLHKNIKIKEGGVSLTDFLNVLSIRL